MLFAPLKHIFPLTPEVCHNYQFLPHNCSQVLDYQNVSHTLLPLVSAAYALHFTAESMVAMYKGFEADREKGDFSALPELHALSSGLKALCTGITADGIEACRRTCGGHGYSALSGLPG